MQIEEIEQSIRETGLTPRGAFHPDVDDAVPNTLEDRPTGTLILVGNAGPAMWDRFAGERDPNKHLLDDWSRDVLDAIAAQFDAKAFFPFAKPHLPFQRWAQRAEACHASPLGVFIHPDYGLWHAYRGALAFAEIIDLPSPDTRPSPCSTCPDQPCLSTCPVKAFSGSSYDVGACVRHVASPAGEDCRKEGCRARRACPIGRDFIYEPAQAQFHIAAFLKARADDAAA